jgi:putative ABC transport system permease protein
MIKHILKLIWNKRKSNILILLEIFLAFLVLFAVLSYVIYNARKFTEPLGFGTDDKWLVNLESQVQADSIDIINLKTALRTELLAMDKIENVSFISNAYPFSGSTSQTSGDRNGFHISTLIAQADNDYNKALDLKLNQGRWFNEEDFSGTYTPLVVNQAFIDEYYNGKNMLDSIIIISGEHKLVGVIDAYRYKGEFSENEPTAFYQATLHHKYVSNMVLDMVPGTTTAYEEDVNKVIKSITKADNFLVRNLDKERKRNSSDTWIPMIILMSICGFLCINVALGLFGVLWYNINKRKGEIGLRRAIGAHSSDIKKQFVLEIIILALVGILLGVFFAIQVPLLKLGPLEPINMYWAILLSAAIILILVTLCALQPSWQASKVHPATALHEE